MDQDLFQRLVELDASHLQAGIYIDTGVYVRFHKDYTLLCQNKKLGQEDVDKIKDFELDGAAICVEPSTYEMVEKQYLHFSSSPHRRLKENYAFLRNEVAAAFSMVMENHKIALQTTEHITKEIDGQLKAAEPAMVIQCIGAARSADERLYLHSLNVALLNGLAAHWFGLSQSETEELIHVGVLHDLGKLRVDDAIINKPAKLTPEEFAAVQLHPVYSYEILVNSGMHNEKILTAVRGHHERLNGLGYPDHLSSDQIGLYSRITTISDIYDAMVANRVYKPAFSPFEVLSQFADDKFSNLDITLVNSFLEKMCMELVGKKILLSDGQIGTVLYVDQNNLAYPIVEANEVVLATNAKLYCVSLCDELI